jgi:hypothetical protein
MLVPRLEREHAMRETGIDAIAHYDEYPGRPAAIEQLPVLLERDGRTAALAWGPTPTGIPGYSATKGHRCRNN